MGRKEGDADFRATKADVDKAWERLFEVQESDWQFFIRLAGILNLAHLLLLRT